MGGTVTPPTITRAEALARLDAANAIRSARAEWRRRLAGLTLPGGCLVTAELITDPPEWAATWPVFGALMCIRGFGPGKVYDLIDSNRVSRRFRVGDLTPRQRDALVTWLRARGADA